MSHIQKQLIKNRGTGLHLTLTHVWYDEIANGNKTVEYREHTDFWHTRILTNWWNRLEGATNLVTFHKGYTSQIMTFKVDCIILRFGVIELHLGERVN